MPVEPNVVFSSEMISNGNNTEHVKFTVDLSETTVSGASVPTMEPTKLVFSPGTTTYIVRINLPSGFTGDGHIQWLDENGSPRLPPSITFEVSPKEGETWVQFGLESDHDTEAFTFRLSTPDSMMSEKDWPTVVSDPPPTLEFRSS